MDTKKRIDEYRKLDRDIIIDRLRKSVANITDYLTKNGVEKEIITSSTLGVFFLFSISDNHTDSEEYQFFLQAFNAPIPAEDYRSLARQCGTAESIKRFAATASYIAKVYPELSADIEQIALCAIAANGKITDDEEKFFNLVFGDKN